VDLDEFSSLCSTGHTPQILTGAFLRILQNHFSTPSNIEKVSLRDNIARLDPEDTTEGVATKGIKIQPVWKWNPKDIELRPAIYIKRNALQTQKLGINDGLTVGLGTDQDGDLQTYKGDYHTVGVLGSHTLFCIGRTGAETEVLAYEVFREMHQFAPVVRRDLKLAKLAVTQMTDVSKLEEYDQNFTAGVVVGWAYFEAWRLKYEAPWLKTLVIDLRASD
jgi:hypothetical protein